MYPAPIDTSPLSPSPFLEGTSRPGHRVGRNPFEDPPRPEHRFRFTRPFWFSSLLSVFTAA